MLSRIPRFAVLASLVFTCAAMFAWRLRRFMRIQARRPSNMPRRTLFRFTRRFVFRHSSCCR